MATTHSQISLQVGSTRVVLHPDGTVSSEGARDTAELIDAIGFLKRPSAGREWWIFMLIHEIDISCGMSAAKAAAAEVYNNPTRRSNSCNRRFVTWLLEQELHKRASVECVTNAKSFIWNASAEEPKRSNLAKKVIKLLKDGISWADLKKIIEGRNTA